MFSRTERMVSSRWRYFRDKINLERLTCNIASEPLNVFPDAYGMIFRYNLLFLFYFNPEWSFQRIQVFLDANLPFGIALYVIFAPCCTEVIAVFLAILQAALQAQGMTGGTVVLLVEELDRKSVV